MNGFTKLHSGILDSSIWQEDMATRIVWITLLAKANASGNVIMCQQKLLTSANVSSRQLLSALEKLTSPDTNSKTPTAEGRRIKVIQGGWHIINHGLYRTKRDPHKRRQQNREAKRRERQRVKKSATCQPMSAQAEAEAEAEADKESVQRKADVKTQYLDSVWLSPKEHARLISDFSQERTEEYTERLNNWIASKGYESKSHYHTIRKWIIEDQGKEQTKAITMYPIGGKNCSKCVMPAVDKTAGDYGDHYYCKKHIPPKRLARLREEGYDV